MSDALSRWTVSVHRVGEGFERTPKDHLDWFFEPVAESDEIEHVDHMAKGPGPFQDSESLVTFASELIPEISTELRPGSVRRDRSIEVTTPGVTVVTATRLPAHRKIYLDYEGEVSGNRGRIKPIATGLFRPVTDGGRELISARVLDVGGAESDLAGVVHLAENWVKQLLAGDRVRVFFRTEP